MGEMTGNRRVVKLSDLSASSNASEKKAPEELEQKTVNETIESSEVNEASEANQSNEANEASSTLGADFLAELMAAEKAEDLAEAETKAEPEKVMDSFDEAPVQPATEPIVESISKSTPIEDSHETLADALAAIHREEEQKQVEVEKVLAEQVSDEVGIIAAGTRVLGDIVTDGHLEINGVVQGSINARGNVRVNGDVYGDIACGNLIIREGVLKINVQAREDISLGELARIEGDIRCRKIGVKGTIVGNITATELVQLSESAQVNGNITTGGISIGMGAILNGSVRTIK